MAKDFLEKKPFEQCEGGKPAEKWTSKGCCTPVSGVKASRETIGTIRSDAMMAAGGKDSIIKKKSFGDTGDIKEWKTMVGILGTDLPVVIKTVSILGIQENAWASTPKNLVSGDAYLERYMKATNKPVKDEVQMFTICPRVHRLEAAEPCRYYFCTNIPSLWNKHAVSETVIK